MKFCAFHASRPLTRQQGIILVSAQSRPCPDIAIAELTAQIGWNVLLYREKESLGGIVQS